MQKTSQLQYDISREQANDPPIDSRHSARVAVYLPPDLRRCLHPSSQLLPELVGIHPKSQSLDSLTTLHYRNLDNGHFIQLAACLLSLKSMLLPRLPYQCMYATRTLSALAFPCPIMRHPRLARPTRTVSPQTARSLPCCPARKADQKRQTGHDLINISPNILDDIMRSS
ncbi:hypothetical protein OPQ81_003644 [Rhizoctonia solani]|nr:hypothetical protein OPQ81_003644 [Rhizoctonia solani]